MDISGHLSLEFPKNQYERQPEKYKTVKLHSNYNIGIIKKWVDKAAEALAGETQDC